MTTDTKATIASILLAVALIALLFTETKTTYEVIEHITIEQAQELTQSDSIDAVECTGLYSIFVEEDTMVLVEQTTGTLFKSTKQYVTTTYNSNLGLR